MTGAATRAAAEQMFRNRTVAEVDAGPTARFQDWLDKAQPGARLVYASGWHAAKAAGSVLAEWFAEQAERKMVHLVQKRREDGEGFDYIAERSSRTSPAKPGEPDRRADHFGVGRSGGR